MKFKLIIMLVIVSLMYGITLRYDNSNVETVESALGGQNLLTYRAYLDTISYSIWEHKYLTASHEKADSTTYFSTANDSVYGNDGTLRQTIAYLTNIRAYLSEHMALDSCHNGSADEATVLPAVITYSPNTTLAEVKNYADSLKLSMNAHFARTISTRYKILGKEITADFIAHCANDTTDGGDVHYKADETYNTVTFDSTNVDSVIAGFNRLKGRYNGHLSLYAEDGSEVHQGHDATDSVTVADATNYATLYALVNSLKAKYNAHCAQTSAVWVSSIHKAADATNVVTGADVTVGGGHIAADAGTLTGLAHTAYYMSDYARVNVTAVASAVASGAILYIAGSHDDITYFVQDSIVVTADGLNPKQITALWKYIKVYCNAYTDGTYKIQFLGGE